MEFHLQPIHTKSTKRLMLIRPTGTLKSFANKFIICQYTNGKHLISFAIKCKHSLSDMESTAVHGEENPYEITILSFSVLVETEDYTDSPFTSTDSGLNSNTASSHYVEGNSPSEVNEQQTPTSLSSLSVPQSAYSQDSVPDDEDAQNSESSETESSDSSTSNGSDLTPSQLEDLATLDALVANLPSDPAYELVPVHPSINDNDLFPYDINYNYYNAPEVLPIIDNHSIESCLGIIPTLCTPTVADNETNQLDTHEFSSQPSCTNQDGAQTVIHVNVPPKSKKLRAILPGPPIPKIVTTSGKERLLQRLNPIKRDEAKNKVAVLPEKELLRDIQDGDNHLMVLVSKPHRNLLELVHALVERMRLIPGALEATNNEGESALYIASVSLPEEPVVARYMAETLLDMDVDIAELAYENGQSLAHCVSERGDSHRNVLAELLSLKDPDTGQPVFNLNKPSDRSGHTPLHVAACSHGKDNVCSIATVRLLVNQGANLLEQDWQAGFSVLHIAVREACDPPLVLAILEEARNTTGGPKVAANQVTYNGDTPLHLVAVNDQVCIKKQCEAFRLLLYHGADRSKRNRGGKVALALVANARKEEIRKALPKR